MVGEGPSVGEHTLASPPRPDPLPSQGWWKYPVPVWIYAWCAVTPVPFVGTGRISNCPNKRSFRSLQPS